jgi:hypothetical protein
MQRIGKTLSRVKSQQFNRPKSWTVEWGEGDGPVINRRRSKLTIMTRLEARAGAAVRGRSSTQKCFRFKHGPPADLCRIFTSRWATQRCSQWADEIHCAFSSNFQETNRCPPGNPIRAPICEWKPCGNRLMSAKLEMYSFHKHRCLILMHLSFKQPLATNQKYALLLGGRKIPYFIEDLLNHRR